MDWKKHFIDNVLPLMDEGDLQSFSGALQVLANKWVEVDAKIPGLTEQEIEGVKRDAARLHFIRGAIKACLDREYSRQN